MTAWLRSFYRTWGRPVFGMTRPIRAARQTARFLRQFRRYRRMSPRETVRLADAFPCLDDAVARTGVDPHYFHQATWAFDRIRRHASWHVDVGSQLGFIGLLSGVVPVHFLDLRPPAVQCRGLMPVNGSILALPFRDGSVPSLSSLHVLEHIGLGRYGDPLDPDGTRLAARELARVLRKGGNLFVSMPVGRPRVCFNAHRVLAPPEVVAMFAGLSVRELSMVGDDGRLREGASLDAMSRCDYGCGLFWFTK
jgi:hypothetical protein